MYSSYVHYCYRIESCASLALHVDPLTAWLEIFWCNLFITNLQCALVIQLTKFRKSDDGRIPYSDSASKFSVSIDRFLSKFSKKLFRWIYESIGLSYRTLNWDCVRKSLAEPGDSGTFWICFEAGYYRLKTQLSKDVRDHRPTNCVCGKCVTNFRPYKWWLLSRNRGKLYGTHYTGYSIYRYREYRIEWTV